MWPFPPPLQVHDVMGPQAGPGPIGLPGFPAAWSVGPGLGFGPIGLSGLGFGPIALPGLPPGLSPMPGPGCSVSWGTRTDGSSSEGPRGDFQLGGQ
jgi:hypothetical protein